MRETHFKRTLCALLCTLLLVQTLTPGASALWEDTPEETAPEEDYSEWAPAAPEEDFSGWEPQVLEEEVPLAETPGADATLHDGNAVIPQGASLDTVKRALAEALLDDPTGVDPLSLEWEYYCEGKNGLTKNEAWGSIVGFTSTKKVVFTNVTCTHPALADNADGTYRVRLAGTSAEVTLTKVAVLSSGITLRDGAVTMPLNGDGTVDYAALERDIFDAVYVDSTPALSFGDVEITYYATAKEVGVSYSGYVPLTGGKVGGINAQAGPIFAGTHTIKLAYAGGSGYAACEATASVTLEEKTVDAGEIFLSEGPYTVPVAYTEADTIDYEATETAILNTLVASTSPAGVAVTVEYDAKNVSVTGGHTWRPLNHVPSTLDNTKAFGTGSWTIRLSFPGTDTYTAAETTVTVEMTARPAAPIVFSGAQVTLTIREDLSVDQEALEQAVRAMFTVEDETVDLSGATLEYYATAKSGSVGDLGRAWAPLAGGKISGLNYPAMGEGTHQVRLTWGGNAQYAPTAVEGTVTVKDRERVQFALNEAPYSVGMVFNAEQGYDYDATARAIYGAVVASTTPQVPYEAVKVEYTTTADALGVNFQELGHQGATGLLDFKDGTWRIRISCGDTVAYRGSSVTVEVTTEDHRIQSAVVLREGASFTYNMEPNVMKQAILDQVIDWDASTLPAGVGLESFEILYKAQVDVLDNGMDLGNTGSLVGKIPGLENAGDTIGDIASGLGESTKRFMPIEGGTYLGIAYAAMGAGEQQLQVQFKGNAEYRPSDAAQGAVTVKKADVKVKVHSTNIYANQPLPEDFITTEPADRFEFYTLYVGATSNVNLDIHLDLPDKYDNNKLIKLVDPLVEKIAGISFSEMLQNGVTLGQLRQLLTNTELLDLLEKIGVDTGAFGQILRVVAKLPSVTDGVRIGFGAPVGQAGLYTVTAISDNRNYNTGVGVGALLVRMRLKGVKLTWNQSLGSKISAADAKTFDFGVTLSYDGDVSIEQGSVHYLYSGFTSKWRAYSSTTTPPTEPGRYVMTVVTLGGNYQAAPITRSFQITK